MNAKASTRSISVGLLALPESTPTALYGLYEVLSSVGVVWSQLTGEAGGDVRFDVRIVAPGRDGFLSDLGVPIAPHAAIGEAGPLDVVIVTDLTLTHVGDPRGRWPEASAWLRTNFDEGATVCSVCTGSILLADAGLLDGLEATTHWSACPLFADYFPAVRLRPERVVLVAGADQRIVTSGGSASWEDLALYLIARFAGQAEAVRTSKIFIFGDRSEGQLPYAVMRRTDRHEDAAVAASQAWIAEHYAAANPVARMVARSGLPERTFKRRFRAVTGYAPVEYVQAVRVEEAKQMLETSDAPTDTVAHEVGYEDVAFFRRLFKRKTGVTPARYRQRFQSIGRLKRAP